DTERLHDVDPRVHYELSGIIHLAENVDLVAVDLPNGDRHDGAGDVPSEALGDFQPQVVHGLPDGAQVAGQRKGTYSVRPHKNFLIEAFLSPYRDLQDIARLNEIAARIDGIAPVVLRMCAHDPRARCEHREQRKDRRSPYRAQDTLRYGSCSVDVGCG